MDGGSWALDGADHRERQNAEEQAKEGKGKAQKRHHLQLKGVLPEKKGHIIKPNINCDNVSYVSVFHGLDI